MGKIATNQSVSHLQKIFDCLGQFGGTIETKNPDNWWTLDLEVESVDEKSKDIMIGIFESINGDAIFDPQFNLTLKMKGNKIQEAEIHNCINQTTFGITEVDSDDILYGFWGPEKSPTSLTDLFEGFMYNMAEDGPYLADPKKITKYDKTLSD